jgi:hypothetical protein
VKQLLSVAAGLAAGALAMYYLDSRNGARRRALVRDKVLAAGRDAAEFAHLKGRHVAGRVKGVVARSATYQPELRDSPEDMPALQGLS